MSADNFKQVAYNDSDKSKPIGIDPSQPLNNVYLKGAPGLARIPFELRSEYLPSEPPMLKIEPGTLVYSKKDAANKTILDNGGNPEVARKVEGYFLQIRYKDPSKNGAEFIEHMFVDEEDIRKLEITSPPQDKTPFRLFDLIGSGTSAVNKATKPLKDRVIHREVEGEDLNGKREERNFSENDAPLLYVPGSGEQTIFIKEPKSGLKQLLEAKSVEDQVKSMLKPEKIEEYKSKTEKNVTIVLDGHNNVDCDEGFYVQKAFYIRNEGKAMLVPQGYILTVQEKAELDKEVEAGKAQIFCEKNQEEKKLTDESITECWTFECEKKDTNDKMISETTIIIPKKYDGQDVVPWIVDKDKEGRPDMSKIVDGKYEISDKSLEGGRAASSLEKIFDSLEHLPNPADQVVSQGIDFNIVNKATEKTDEESSGGGFFSKLFGKSKEA